MITSEPTTKLPIAVRAYALAAGKSKPGRNEWKKSVEPHPRYALIFDTETTTDASQRLRFGCYQVRYDGELIASGFFFDPGGLSDEEQATIWLYSEQIDVKLLTVGEFVDRVFFPYVYDCSALCVGFNLPFDLSRIAIKSASARGKTMHGGFTHTLSEDNRRPNLQVKHLSSKCALIRFTIPAKQRTPRGMRRRGKVVSPHRGRFVDVRTLASAILSGSWSLASLADHLKTNTRKLSVDEHGAKLTEEYLRYGAQDVQATWECFSELNRRYQACGLSETAVSQIYSEASLGKAYFKQMGLQPWRKLQPDFPPDLLGVIMSTYYGGRSEVHVRRRMTPVCYCDFLSMYPTVCVLMNLWRFAISTGITHRDATEQVQEFLDSITLDDLQERDIWKKLTVLVEVLPEDDLFPARSKYDGKQYTIGLNHVTSKQPMWYTLADCIASKILTGRTPRVLRAVKFLPDGIQDGLQAISIAGNPDYLVDPTKEDFYKRLIEMRNQTKLRLKECAEDELASLHTEQLALKICANATSYGIFVELNVSEQDKTTDVTCYGKPGDGFVASVTNTEDPGKYFHPLLATLITGAARLMLAITERLAEDAGLTWAFCDTDSMALTPTEEANADAFQPRAKDVVNWFVPLNPYAKAGAGQSVLKVEDENYRLELGPDGPKLTRELDPLWCFAVSSKRYALFNIGPDGQPALRKLSAHGLGHLLPPYQDKAAPVDIPQPAIDLHRLGVERWHHDLWFRIIQAVFQGHPEQVEIGDLPGYGLPAVSRYAASTPQLLKWFQLYNKGKKWASQVKPFNFMLAFQAKPQPKPHSGVLSFPGMPTRRHNHKQSKVDLPRAVAPYNQDTAAAMCECFDRETGQPVESDRLKTYQESLAQYHLHPEDKFDGGEYTDSGFTRRKHIIATRAEYIGKEANRWEEQFYLGADPETQVVYGMPKEQLEEEIRSIIQSLRHYSVTRVANASGLDRSEVSLLLNGRRTQMRAETLAKLRSGFRSLHEDDENRTALLDAVRRHCSESGISVRELARQSGIDQGNLIRVLSGRRKPTSCTLVKLKLICAV